MRAARTPESGRSDPLLWQSRLLLLTVAPVCATAVAANAGKMRSSGISLAISLLLASIVWLARAATPLAALTGGLVTACTLLATTRASLPQWRSSALPPLLTLFLLTWIATGFGRRRKEALGVAESRRGRNAAQVAANLGMAGIAGAVSLFFSPRTLDSLAPAAGRPMPLRLVCATLLVTALAEATADTLSSELGEVLGGEPILITTGERVVAGADGAVSPMGTLAGGVGALAVVLVAVPAMGMTPRAAAAAIAGAFLGSLLDSLLGATAERRGWLNNDAVNFLSTLGAALVAAGLLIG